MTPGDLGAFIEARLKEDAEIALSALCGPESEPWRVKQYDRVVQRGYYNETTMTDRVIADCGAMGSSRSQHIARHDPARVLREVEAKRAILREAMEAWQWYQGELSEEGGDRYRDGTLNDVRERWDTWERALKLLAAVYEPHPDYRADWKP